MDGKTGALAFCANDSMQHQLVCVTNQHHFMPGIFRIWRLKGRPYMAIVLRNLEPGHCLAEWPFGRLALDVLALPERVTRVDWRVIDYDAQGWDRMALPEPMIAPEADTITAA